MKKELLKKDILILGIESSCDETSASVVKNGKEVLSIVINSQIEEHKKYGGVVPEIASRMHVEAIEFVVKEALDKANITMNDIDGIAVTYGPGLIGALLVGIMFAKGLALAWDKPIIKVNHLEGHIAGNYLTYKELEPPYLSLIISGGHTHIAKVNDYINYEILGKTKDDAVGEAFDKVARVIGLGYPGGPKIDKLAYLGEDNIKIATPKVEGLNFSFSGIKTNIININHNTKNIKKEDLAKSFTEKVCEILYNKTIEAAEMFNMKKIAVCGGVSANSHIRAKFNKLKDFGYDIYFPEMIYCTDNAAMIASQGYFNYINGIVADYNFDARPNLKLGEKI